MHQPKQPPLINTPLQRGGGRCGVGPNRFNGFSSWVKTVETVGRPSQPALTPLKRGANETFGSRDLCRVQYLR